MEKWAPSRTEAFFDLNLSPAIIIFRQSLMDPTGSEGGRYFSGQLLELPERSAEKSRGKKEKTGISRPIQIVVALLTNLLFITKL